MFKHCGTDCFHLDVFWETHGISPAQAIFDQDYPYGIIMTATSMFSQKTILKYESTHNGTMTWHELKMDFQYNGSKELKLVQLENLTQTKYSDITPGGLAGYLETFQANVAELITMDPTEYSDYTVGPIMCTLF